jgi:hypothetical protein
MTVLLKTFNVIIRRNKKVRMCFDVHAATVEQAVTKIVECKLLAEPGDTITIGEVMRTVQDEHTYPVTEDGVVAEKR